MLSLFLPLRSWAGCVTCCRVVSSPAPSFRPYLPAYHDQICRERSLPREDIKIIAETGSPFLFKDASAAKPTMGRMKSFMGDGSNNFSERYTQAPKTFQKEVEMKKGDWLCPSCSFMNFAKNSQCLECEQLRPKKYVTGEWECPECDFLNFSRNVECLRCDCKKPGVKLSSVSDLRADISTLKGGNTVDQQWLTKIVQLEQSSEISSALGDEDLPESMKEGDNSRGNLGVAENCINVKIRQSLDEQHTGEKSSPSAMSQYAAQQQMFNEKSQSQIESKDHEREEAELCPETMPMRKGENRFVVSKKKDRSLTSPMYKRRVAMEQAGNTNNNYVPFVPFPADYFAQNKQRENSESTRANAMNSVVGGAGETKETKSSDPVSEASPDDDYSKSKSLSENAWRERSLEGSAVKEADPLDMSEEAKAERWFRRVAQIKDISELSQIPDEDFPSIMPMRKGVNRFVVSKRKTPLERRLTSSQYRRNLPVVSSDPVKKETDYSEN